MPSSIISHQAPALYLKVKFSDKIDGTAICLATIIPDINIFFDGFLPFSLRFFTHSLLGLIVWTMPITLVFTILFSKYFGPWLAALAKFNNPFMKPLKYFGVDSWNHLKSKKVNKNFFLVGIYSAIIGGLTHLLLDLPAHEYIELFFPLIFKSPEILLFPFLNFGKISTFRGTFNAIIPVYRLIWIVESILLIFPSLYLLRYIKKNHLLDDWYSKNNEFSEKKNLHYET